MALQTIPEDLLYRLLPEAVIDLDERGLLQAVIGGEQDHAETLKSFAKKFELFYSPSSLGDETQYNVVIASFYGPKRNIVNRSVIIDDSTPSSSDQEDLNAWVIEKLELDEADFISASYGFDSDRVVTEDLLDLLATTIGAVIYETSEVSTLEQRRRAVASYFPRLKFKGTSKSFDVLGRMVGFQHVAMIPLWQRASLRKPDNVGDPVNNPDFSAKPQFNPAAETGVLYDPNDVLDGPFYSWSSGSLSLNPDEANYYESVNGFNPFIKIEKTEIAAGHPDPGIYVLAGGAPHNRASVSPSGSGFTFTSLFEGDSFNGVKVLVSAIGTLRQVSIVERLSAIKYRSSHYDLGLFKDLPGLTDNGDFAVIQPNSDLKANPTLVDDGTAQAPFYPWTSGGQQAEADAIQLNTDSLEVLRTQAVPYFEELRAATRTPRRVAAGWSSEDDVIYAAVPHQKVLFTAGTDEVGYSGTVTEHPESPYSVSIAYQQAQSETLTRGSVVETFIRGTLGRIPVRGTISLYDGVVLVATDDGLGNIIDAGPGVVIDGRVDYDTREIQARVSTTALSLEVSYDSLTPMSAESNPSIPGVIYFAGGSVQGFYQTANGSFCFYNDLDEPNTNFPVVALFESTSTEVLRDEPIGTVKSEFRAGYQTRPEDDIPILDASPGSLEQTADDFAWVRPLTAAGAVVHPDMYDSVVPTLESLQYAADEIQVSDIAGIEYQIVGIDDVKSDKDETIRVKFVPCPLSVRHQGQPALAAEFTSVVSPSGGEDYHGYNSTDVANLYHAGLVNGVLVADPVGFSRAFNLSGLVGWYPFNEHPEDDLKVTDRSVVQGHFDSITIQPQNRVWDEDLGWVHRATSGLLLESSVNRGIASAFAFSFRLKPVSGNGSVQEMILRVGSISFDLSAAGTTLIAYADAAGGSRIQIAAKGLSLSSHNFVSFRVDNGTFYYGVAGNETAAPVAEYHAMDTRVIVCSIGSDYYISDLRIWNMNKTKDELVLVRDYSKTPTSVPYPPTYFRSAGKREKWSLQMMQQGFCYPVIIEDASWVPYATIQRYNDEGRYFGDERFKEVGLGGGQEIPQKWQLGMRFYTVSADGSQVRSTTHTNIPGNNKLWDLNAPVPVTIDNAIITIDSTLVTIDSGGTIRPPIPTLMPATNPIRDRIVVQGLNEWTYEAKVDDVGFGPQWDVNRIARIRMPQGTLGYLGYQDLPTGPLVESTVGTLVMTWDQNNEEMVLGPGTVPFERPPVYLYNLTQRVVNQSGTINWVDPTSEGLSVGYPLRNDIGKFQFLNEGTLSSGPHQLNIDASVSGYVGRDFPGFDLEVAVGDNIFPAKILEFVDAVGSRRTDSVEFWVDNPITGKWITTIDWLNDLDNAPQGIQRNLAIHGYELRRMNPRIYQVLNEDSFALIPNVFTTETQGSLTPGGWIASLNSIGTYSEWIHESDESTRPTLEFGRNTSTLADVLTGATADKKEDLLLLAYSGALVETPDPNPGPPVITSNSFIGESETVSWVVVGNVTHSTARIKVKMSSLDTPAVLRYSRSSGLSSITETEAAWPNSDGIVTFDLTRLAANTQYYFAAGGIAKPDVSKVGSFRTFPEEPMSFTFAASHTATTGSTNSVFDTIVENDPLFFLHLGNINTQDINFNSEALFKAAYELTYTAVNQESLYRTRPMSYVWDDLDFGSDSSTASKPAARDIYREFVPSYYLHDGPSASVYHSFECGRVFFIVLDTRYNKGVGTLLGATQKSWLKRQLLDSKNYAMTVICSPAPWIGNDGVDPDDRDASVYSITDTWGEYPVERREIADFMLDNGVTNVAMICGGMKALAVDDGTNSDYTTNGGLPIPVFQVGPLDYLANQLGGPYSGGSYPESAVTAHQFGLFTVTDNGGSEITLTFSGRDETNEEHLSLSVTMTV